MWEIRILGVDFYHVAAWLYLYSFLGWVWESTYVSLKEKKWMNRGFITGPLCTIYGVGAVSVYVVLRPLAGNWILLYLGGVVVATVLEYITAVVMEGMFHTSWWDYSHKKFNYQGRICLGSSIAWGFFTVLMFLVFQPFVEMVVSWFDVTAGKIMIITFTLMYAVDFTFAMVGALQLGKKLQQMEHAMSELADYFQQSKVYTTAGEFLERLEPYRKSFNRSNVKEKMEQYQESIFKLMEGLGQRGQEETVHAKLKTVSEKFITAVAKGSWNSRRLMRSYPYLSKASRLHRKSLRKDKKDEANKRKEGM